MNPPLRKIPKFYKSAITYYLVLMTIIAITLVVDALNDWKM